MFRNLGREPEQCRNRVSNRTAWTHRRGGKTALVYMLSSCLILGVLQLCGCGKKLTDEDIKATKVYQDLETDYAQLNRKCDKLETEKKKYSDNSLEQSTIQNYLASIRSSHFVKVSYAMHNTDIGEITENVSLVKSMKNALAASILDTTVNIDKFKKSQEIKYNYTFYNEDNSLFQCDVYEDDRVIFKDFPERVFYAKDILKLGDGLVKHEDLNAVAKSSIYVTLYHAQLAFLGENLMSEKKMQQVVDGLYQRNLVETEERPQDALGEPKEAYTYYVCGSKYLVHVYDDSFSVEEDQTKTTWYTKKTEETTEESTEELAEENTLRE